MIIKHKELALSVDFNPAIEFIITKKKDILFINKSAIAFFKFSLLSKKDVSISMNKWIDENVPNLLVEPLEKFEYISSDRTVLFTKIIEPKSKRILFFGSDITEQKINEVEIHRLLTGIEQSENALFITDSEGSIIYANKAFETISGYRQNEIIGKKSNIMKSGYHNSEFYNELWNTIIRGEVWHGTFLNKRKSGELYWEKATITPVWNNENEIFSFIAIKEDITDLKQMEQDLRIAKDEAEKASILKGDFLANMSHEIRTPLTGILGFTDILLSDEADTGKKDMLKLIRKSGNNLLDLINDILDLSRIEADKLTIVQEPFSPFKMFAFLEKQFKVLSDKKSLQLEFDISSDIPVLLNGGEKQIRHILNNLIGNAIKFTDTGFVRVNSYYENGILLISVTDSGIGISEKEKKKIFDSFQQGDSANKKYGGTGLGLTISKKLADLMDGEISVQSISGEGSCFCLKIPLLPVNSYDETEPSPVIPLDDVMETNAETSVGGQLSTDHPDAAISSDVEKSSQYLYNTAELDDSELEQLRLQFKNLKKHALDENIDEVLTVAEEISLISQKPVIRTIAYDLRKIWEHIDQAALATFILKTQPLWGEDTVKD